MKVAIIGAGASGLPSIKSCLEEGLEPVCFEKTHDIGGLWRFEDGMKFGATVYKTTVINSSKETLGYSDFPIPEHFPNFMHHTKVMDYYNLYAERFGLRRCIRFHTEVISCRRDEDFEETGRWLLTVKNTKTKVEETLEFDGVLVCIGHHAQPHYPVQDFPGLDRFKGSYLHSNSYRDTSKYVDKNVLVVGTGNSGCDIAVELSRCTKQTFLSTRSGTWVFNRIMDNGTPFDLLLVTRFKAWLTNNFPSLMNPFYEANLNSRFDHEKYGLRPQHRVLSQHPTINDELPNRIVNGTIVIKGGLEEFEEDKVRFADGSVEDVDAAVFATGYSFSFPFLEDNIIKTENNESNLYKLMWPMNLKQNTLAIIGLTQTSGVIGPVAEIQGRWATKVIQGKCKLPSEEDMKQDYDEMMLNMRNTFINSKRHTIEVDGVMYMDCIAEQIECKPNLWWLALCDPVLAWQVFFGPFTSYQYRLCGSGKWKDARKAILTQWDRVWRPMERQQSSGGSKTGLSWYFLGILLALMCFLAVM